jgi:uncharacterized membrane protein
MWIERDLPLKFWIQRWLLNISSTFFDWQVIYSERFFDVEQVQDFVFSFNIFSILLAIAIFGLILYSICFLFTNCSSRNSFFLLLLISVPAVVFGFPDLILGGQRSTVARYMMGIPLGIQLIVAYCIGTKISCFNDQNWQRLLWRIVLVITVTLSVVCSWQMIKAPTWWNKYSSYYNAEVADIVNQSEKPLVISNVKRISRSTSLSYKLKDNANFLLLEESNSIPNIPNTFTDIFLFRPYPNFLQNLQQNNSYTIEPVFTEGHLYKLNFKE